MSTEPFDPASDTEDGRRQPAASAAQPVNKPTFEQFAADPVTRGRLYFYGRGLLYAWNVPEHRLRPEDVVADTLSALWERWDKIDYPRTCMRYIALDLVHRAARESGRFAGGLIHRDPGDETGEDAIERQLDAGVPVTGGAPLTPEEELAWQEAERRVNEVFDQAGLTDLERQAFERCVMYGEPRAELAKTLNVKAGSLSQPISRGKNKLRRFIGDVRPRGGLVLAVLAGAGGVALLAVLAYALRGARPGEVFGALPLEALAPLALAVLSQVGQQVLREGVRDRVRRWAERRYGADRLRRGVDEERQEGPDRLDDLSLLRLLRLIWHAESRGRRRRRDE